VYFRGDKPDDRLPNPGYFPFEYVDIRVPSVGKFDESQIVNEGSTIRIIKNKNNIPSSSSGVNGVNGTNGVRQDEVVVSKQYPTDLSTTLQYAQGFGDIAMRQWAKEHIKVLHLHNPPYPSVQPPKRTYKRMVGLTVDGS
jgi:aromatic amino acid aminotransferase I / 2-aminoadipate transaminase